MSLPSLFLAASTAAAAPLAVVGERIGGAEVVDAVDHPEFQRLDVRLEDGRTLSIELAATPTPMGACTHHGLSLQPRWELLGVHDAQLEDQPPVVTTLCARLEEQGAPVSLRPPQTGQDTPGGSGSAGSDVASGTAASADAASSGAASSDAASNGAALVRIDRTPAYSPSWMSAVVALLGLFSLFTVAGRGRSAWASWARQDRVEVAALTLVALLARAGLGLWSVLWAPSFGFGRLSASQGAAGSVPLYGDGFAALMGLPVVLLGPHPDAFFGVQLLLGTLAVPLVWGLTRVLTADTAVGRLAPLLAGGWVALLPSHVWLSTSEVMHISLVTVELLAAVFAVLFVRAAGDGRGMGVALSIGSALATGLAVHIRPEAFPFIVVPASWVVWHAGRAHRLGLVLAVLVVAGLSAPRLLTLLLEVSPSESAVDYSRLTELHAWLSFFTPTASEPSALAFVNTALHPRFALPVFVPMALVGLFAAPRRVAVWLALWWAVATTPILLKAWPLADALRLQLPGLMPVVVLAGIGTSAVVGRLMRPWGTAHDRPRLRLAIGAGLLVVLLPHTVLARPAWGPITEARHFIDAIELVPETATVFYDDADTHVSGMVGWAASQRLGSRWRPMSMGTAGEPLTSPLMAWVGTSCDALPRLAEPDVEPSKGCLWLRQQCTLRPAAVVEVSGETDLHLKDFDGPVTVGLYYVDDCQGGAAD